MDVSPATEFMSVSQDVLPVFTGIPVKANIRISTKMGMQSLCFKMLGLGPESGWGNLPASELRLRLFIQHNTLLKKYIVDEWDHGIYSWFIQAT